VSNGWFTLKDLFFIKAYFNKEFKGERVNYLIDGKRQWKYNHFLQFVENYTAISFYSGDLNTRWEVL
jgi:hypothetical protein